MIVETGYVIVKADVNGVNTYFRGGGRGASEKWAKTLRSAQIYKGVGNARKSIATSNKIAYYDRDSCRVLKVKVILEDAQ